LSDAIVEQKEVATRARDYAPVAAFAALTDKQKRFVAAYMRHGVASRAAAEAGYATPHDVTGHQALNTAGVQAALVALGVAAEQAAANATLSAIERRAILANVARDKDKAQRPHALRAIEIDARLTGADGQTSTEAGPLMTPDAAGELVARVLAGFKRGVDASRDNLVSDVVDVEVRRVDGGSDGADS
jgi:hypothetical protein